MGKPDNKFVTLEDVLGYAADVFCIMMEACGRILGQDALSLGRALSVPTYKQELISRFDTAGRLAAEHGWGETAHRIAEFIGEIENGVSVIILQSKCADLENHICRLFTNNLFFHAANSKEFFKWTQLKDQKHLYRFFPSATLELGHAAQCYLFDEGTASVFHSMRAFGISLNVLADSLGVPVSDKDQMEVIINNCEGAIKQINGPHAGPDWRKRRELYSDAALHFRFLKDAWRNHVMHGRAEYSAPESLEVLNHITTFLSSLITGLELKEPRADAINEAVSKP